jgi:7-carboxy-7-deazaguanine synthase
VKRLKVSEIFYSLQGEGARAGEPSVFIRLSNCDLACSFCDTEFASGKEYTLEQLLAELAKLKTPCRWIVWTGGEPCLQLDAEAVEFFKNLGFKQAIETNGGHKPPAGLDWVCCSPKVAQHVWEKCFPDGVDELRLVRHSGQPALPDIFVPVKRKFVSPIFDGQNPIADNLRHCIKLCLANPEWSLSLQTHKLTRIL